MKLVITPDVNFRQMAFATRALGEATARQALARALNHTGRKALTAVRRALVIQTSIPRAAVVAGVTDRPARAAGSEALRYVIVGTGRRLPLKLFRARQTASGVTARVWGGPRAYRSAFIVASLGHHVFRRQTRRRLPIEKLFGPSLAEELVKDQSRAAFERVIADLPARLSHELRRVLP